MRARYATPGTIGFSGVPEAVWDVDIGGYQLCEKCLKDRNGRKLLKADIEHYKKIVVAIVETIRIMKEIDEDIEKHRRWPGAFRTGKREGTRPIGEAQRRGIERMRRARIGRLFRAKGCLETACQVQSRVL